MNERNIFGMLNSDGSIASWPEADLNGVAVNRANATRAQVDSNKFVVMPMNMQFTDELRAALMGGYDGLQALRSKTVLAPPVGFTVIEDERTTLAVPLVESFSKKKVASDDNS